MGRENGSAAIRAQGGLGRAGPGACRVTERKPWRTKFGAAIGLIVGGALWWDAYQPGGGLFQNAQLVLVSVAAGVLVVIARNWHRQVGPFDPEVQEANRRGRP